MIALTVAIHAIGSTMWLGYEDVTPNPAWRQLSGMVAMVGIVVSGLTTAMFFTVIQRLWRVGHTASNDS